MRLLTGIVSLAFASTALAQAESDRRAEMDRVVEYFHGVFDVAYAPKEWKEKHFGWSLDTEIAKLKTRIAADDAPTVKDFQRELATFFNSMKDYHTSITFNRTEKATLPFDVLALDGHYYLAWIDRDKLPANSFPFNPGDELLTLDGRPTAEVVAELRNFDAAANPETNEIVAARLLTRRYAKFGMPVPQGRVSLGIARTGSDRAVAHQLIWDYEPEKITDPVTPESLRPARDLLRAPNALVTLPAADLDRSPLAVGTRDSFVPALGTKIWESAAADTFHAYVFRAENGKLVGYLRIASYVGGETEAKAFATLVQKLEDTTDALVLDQVNNPGGSVFYLYALAAMLTDQAIPTPRHRIAITQQSVDDAIQLETDLAGITTTAKAKEVLGETLGGYPVTYEVVRFILDYARFIQREWAAGHYLTEPYHLYGVDHINPYPGAHYSKPILMLINNLDFSGGDFFPAILQDNHRVTMVGTRTAGAGGYVDDYSLPNRLGIAGYRLTGSIAERVDLNPIENLGIKPDVELKLTREDLTSGYASYKAKILAELAKLTGG